LQTVFSATIFRKERESTLFDTLCYHPLDSIFRAYSFFVKMKPDIYVVNRHDIWPSHLFVANFLNIETVLINANVHEESKRQLFFLESFNKALFGKFSKISCGSERLKRSVLEMNKNSIVEVTGDTRFDQVKSRAETNLYNHFSDALKRDKIVLGSIIPSDYGVVFGAIRAHWEDKKGLDFNEHIIAVPHEVAESDLQILEKELDKFGLTHKRLSRDKKLGSQDVTIADSVGVLAELYGYAKLSYVGAGFGAGVHSVIEPAVYHTPVSYGPNISLLDEAVEMAELGFGTVVKNSNDFKLFLELSTTQIDQIKENSERFFEKRNDVSGKLVELFFS
jgi:3-deoxy-D-manno-octulosonic-acid transferase